VGRLLENWLTGIVAATAGDLAVIERRIEHNADWRRAEPAARFLYDKCMDGRSEREWAAEQGMDIGELRESLKGLEVWVNIRALRLERMMFVGDAA